MITVSDALPEDIAPWLAFAENIREEFPGLETEEDFLSYKEMLVVCIRNKGAICAKEDGRVIGVLLYSMELSMVGCLAVDASYRRRHIATRMMERMKKKLGAEAAIEVTTYREGDKKGAAARKFYESQGFLPAELGVEYGYPVQRLVCHPGKKESGLL